MSRIPRGLVALGLLSVGAVACTDTPIVRVRGELDRKEWTMRLCSTGERVKIVMPSTVAGRYYDMEHALGLSETEPVVFEFEASELASVSAGPRTLGVMRIVSADRDRCDAPGDAQMLASRPSDTTIVLTRTFAAPRDVVFVTLTRPEHLRQWMHSNSMTLETCDVDLRVGGSLRYVYRRASGRTLEVRGVYEAVEPPRRLAYRESYDFSQLVIQVETVLDEAPDGTVLRQTLRYASKAERDADFDPVVTSGGEAYGRLDRYLANRPMLTPSSDAAEQRDQPVTKEDLLILEKAAGLLKTEAQWNRSDDRECADDEAAGRRSLFCALQKACIDVLGKYDHRRVALQEVRFAVEEATRGQDLEHRLRDFNNLPTTTLADIQRVLQVATSRVQGRLK